LGIGLYALYGNQNPISEDDLFPTEGTNAFPAVDFTMLNQNNESFTLSDTDGQVRILTFIYTKCTMGCTVVNANLAELRDQLQEKDMFDQVQLITIDFDTVYDTHADLVAYAEQYVEDGDRWQFLTTPDSDYMNQTARAYKFSYFDNTTMMMNDTMDMNMTTSVYDSGNYQVPLAQSPDMLGLNQDMHMNHTVVWIHPFIVYFIDQNGMVRYWDLHANTLDIDYAVNVVDYLLND
jgi:cytochrome oxidase Cu insertion factor (SCO1/SenC/PrrC family)